METMVGGAQGKGNSNKEVQCRPLYGGGQGGEILSFKWRSKTEAMVWWSAGGGNLNTEASWRPLYGGAQGGTFK